MIFDFHTHTFLSDGSLSPSELIRRAYVNGYKVIAVTDHVGLEDHQHVVPILVKECEALSRELDILAIPGVEITHVPKNKIDQAARNARELGAQVIIVHGETTVEPVEQGTNLAAITSDQVDILAHPGIISKDDVKLAKETGTFLEISSRRGHSLSNGRVAKLATATGTKLILNSDAHEPEDLLTTQTATKTLAGAGLEKNEQTSVLRASPLQLLKQLGLTPSNLG